MHDESRTSPHRFLGAWFAVLTLLGYALHATGLTPLLHPYITTMYGSFLFCIAPGFALFCLFSFFQRPHYGYLTLLLISTSMGFTFNFLSNVGIYLTGPSLGTATSAYLVVVVLMYAALVAVWSRRGELTFRPPEPLNLRVWLPVLGGTLVFTLVMFHRQPHGYFIEELMVLRKIMDNSTITAANLAFQANEYTTYFFVPFYLFISMVADYAGVDAYVMLPNLWAFTALASVLCVAKVLHLLTGKWGGAIAFAAMSMFHALFLPQPTSNWLTVFLPFPDRYALAAGVLIPLALFHFLVHISDKKLNIPTFVGLVYLVMEMTFIHARDTLFLVGVIVVMGALLLYDLRTHRALLWRIASLLVVLAACLVVYKQTSLALNPELKGFVANERDQLITNFKAEWATKGVPYLFGNTEYYQGYSYEYRFGSWWITRGYNFASIALLLTPVYCLLVQRISLLLLPAVVVGFHLFAFFGGIKVLIGIVVGAPFFFNVFAVSILLHAMVAADICRVLATYSVRSPRVFLRCALLVGLTTYWAMTHNPITPYVTGSRLGDVFLHLGTLAAVIVRVRSLKGCGWWTEAVPREQPTHRYAFRPAAIPIACGLAILFVLPVSRHLTDSTSCIYSTSRELYRDPGETDFTKTYWGMHDARLFHVAWKGHKANSDDIYDLRLPPAVIDYVREDVPELQTWFGGATAPITLIGNHYAPSIAYDGIFNFGFHCNKEILVEYHGEQVLAELNKLGLVEDADFTDFITTEAGTDRIMEILDGHQVGWIIVRPEEQAQLRSILPDRPRLRARLEEKFSADGFSILRYLEPASVVASETAPADRDLDSGSVIRQASHSEGAIE